MASPKPTETFLGTLPGDNKPCSTPVATTSITARINCDPVCLVPTSVCSAGEPTGPTPNPPVTETLISSGACTATVEVSTPQNIAYLSPCSAVFKSVGAREKATHLCFRGHAFEHASTCHILTQTSQIRSSTTQAAPTAQLAPVQPSWHARRRCQASSTAAARPRRNSRLFLLGPRRSARAHSL